MMARKRRVFGAAFKAKVALAAAKGDRTTAQLASQFGIHTSQVTAWKKQFMAQVAELFADGRQRRVEQPALQAEFLPFEKQRGQRPPEQKDDDVRCRPPPQADRGELAPVESIATGHRLPRYKTGLAVPPAGR